MYNMNRYKMRGRNPVPLFTGINPEVDVELERPNQWSQCNGVSESSNTQNLQLQLLLVNIVGYIYIKVQQGKTRTRRTKTSDSHRKQVIFYSSFKPLRSSFLRWKICLHSRLKCGQNLWHKFEPPVFCGFHSV